MQSRSFFIEENRVIYNKRNGGYDDGRISMAL